MASSDRSADETPDSVTRALEDPSVQLELLQTVLDHAVHDDPAALAADDGFVSWLAQVARAQLSPKALNAFFQMSLSPEENPGVDLAAAGLAKEVISRYRESTTRPVPRGGYL
jgi:hypothetical protein